MASAFCATVIEAHKTWTGPCECVKPLLYRVSLDKEEVKFCTADIDKVCRASPPLGPPMLFTIPFNLNGPVCTCGSTRLETRDLLPQKHTPWLQDKELLVSLFPETAS